MQSAQATCEIIYLLKNYLLIDAYCIESWEGIEWPWLWWGRGHTWQRCQAFHDCPCCGWLSCSAASCHFVSIYLFFNNILFSLFLIYFHYFCYCYFTFFSSFLYYSSNPKHFPTQLPLPPQPIHKEPNSPQNPPKTILTNQPKPKSTTQKPSILCL